MSARDGEDVVARNLPGLYVALQEKRMDDAVRLAKEMIEGSTPVEAVIAAVSHGLYLHQSPAWSVQQLAVIAGAHESGVTLTDSTTGEDIGLEFLEVLEGMSPDGSPGEAASALLARFEQRPGSAKAVEMIARVAHMLMTDLQIQAVIPVQRRSPAARTRFAFASARAALRREPTPNLFDPSWDDGASS